MGIGKFIAALTIISLFCSCSSKIKPVPEPGDEAITVPAPYNIGKKIYNKIKRRSFYLTMHDSVKIAIDLYLPKPLPESTKLPTIIEQTRYWRSAQLRTLFRPLFDKPYPIVTDFVKQGYAFVYVDTRGTGASFGDRAYCYSQPEIKDGAEIVEWIIKQPWSNGNVGATGISYDGASAEFLATNMHPAVKAVMPRYTLFDSYSEITLPGGIQLNWFSKEWQKLNNALDKNTVPALFEMLLGRIGAWAILGVRPVDDDPKGIKLAGAVRQHETNWNVHETASRVMFRDDTLIVKVGYGTIDTLSPFNYITKLEKSAAAFYSETGWFDAGYTRSAIRRFCSLRNPHNRLIIGPWPHAGFYCSSPSNAGVTRFDHTAEMMKFFDYYLKGKETGIKDEMPVHYYTMVEEKWKSSDSWPIKAQMTPFYFNAGNRLSIKAPSDSASSDSYRVDYSHGTGNSSRWNSLIGGLFVNYPDRAEQDNKLLVYDSEPLGNDIEVTGHPIVHLYVSSSDSDGAFFVYLEDRHPDGQIDYVTEGMLRALHRNVSEDKPPYALFGPYHTFMRKDAQPLVPGEVAYLTFDLLPTSYVFKKDHTIRIALAGADKDHFALIPTEPPIIHVYHGATYTSRIELPFIMM